MSVKKRWSRSVPQSSTNQLDGLGKHSESMSVLANESLIKLNSAWVEGMLVRNQFENNSVPFRMVAKKLNEEATRTSGHGLQLLKINFNQKDLVKITWIENREIEIRFIDLIFQIDSDLKWTVKNCSSRQLIDMVKIVGNTIQVQIHQLYVGQVKSLSLKLSWTPKRQLIAIETELNLDTHNSIITPIDFGIQSYGRSEKEDAPWYGGQSMLSLIDDVFPDEPYFSASNLSTLIRDGMNLRQSLCFHWLMYWRINHTLSERLTCHRVNDLCNLIAHFVQMKQLFRTPNHCLACTVVNTNQLAKDANHRTNNSSVTTRFGSRRMVQIVDQAEVIFLVDGACHNVQSPRTTIRLMLQLNRLSNVIEKEFRLHHIKTRFMIVMPNQNGQYEPVWPAPEPQFVFEHFIKFKFRHWKPKQNGTLVWNETLFRESLWNPSGRHSLDFLYTFPYSPRRSSRHFIMIDCNHLLPKQNMSQFTCQENDIDFNTARNILLQSNNYFHVITNLGLSQQSMFSPAKMRHIIGIDWRQVMFDNQLLKTSSSSNDTSFEDKAQKNNSKDHNGKLSQWLRQHIRPQPDVCHVLALETNGTIFNHRTLKQANRKAFAERLVANHQMHTCQRCDCTLAKDFLVSHQECFLCTLRHHTLLSPFQRIRNPELWQEMDRINESTITKDDQNQWPFDSPQIWTHEDQEEFNDPDNLED